MNYLNANGVGPAALKIHDDASTGSDITVGAAEKTSQCEVEVDQACAIHTDSAPSVVNDYPTPKAIADRCPFFWDDDEPAAELYPAFGRRLRASGDLYRRPGYASGLLLASPCPEIPAKEITKGSELASIIVDRLSIAVFKNGKLKGSQIPSGYLKYMLQSELFLREFQPLDQVVKRPMYLGTDYELSQPGYNDYGHHNRIFYVGEAAPIIFTHDTIDQFLKVMAFATDADRTNAVAAALTVLLRNYWQGAKPMPIVTSTKSHGGKDTVVAFFSGRTRKVSISYEKADWALQKLFVSAVKFDAEVGVVNIENVRLDGGGCEISSAFLERFVTDAEPLLQSTGTGAPVQRPNHWVVAMTTNMGSVSEDLMNRSLPIHLSPTGDVSARKSAIGNPKDEFLPANREQIEAELRGMVEVWKRAGMPMDEHVKHPFSQWAKVIGGILSANGYEHFLANYGVRRTVNDPVHKALGLLGNSRPGEWLSATNWLLHVTYLGLIEALIPEGEGENPVSRSRGLGVVLSAHEDETFEVETDDETISLQLKKARRRFDRSEPHVRYRFVVLGRELKHEEASGIGSPD